MLEAALSAFSRTTSHRYRNLTTKDSGRRKRHRFIVRSGRSKFDGRKDRSTSSRSFLIHLLVLFLSRILLSLHFSLCSFSSPSSFFSFASSSSSSSSSLSSVRGQASPTVGCPSTTDSICLADGRAGLSVSVTRNSGGRKKHRS